MCLQALEQLLGLGTSVRLDVADHDIDAFGLHAARRLQHRVGLADAGRRAEEDLQLAATRRLLLRLYVREQGVRVGAAVFHRPSVVDRAAAVGAAVAAASRGRAHRHQRQHHRRGHDQHDGVIPRHHVAHFVASSATFSCRTLTRGFAQHAELAWFGVGRDQRPHLALVEATHTRDAPHLVVGRRRTDVRIEPAGRCRHQVLRHRCLVVRIGLFQGGNALLDRVDQRRIGRTLVGAARRHPVVGLRTGGRRAAPEVLRIRKRLADQRRADRLAVAHDQAAIGRVAHRELRHAGDDARIHDPGHDRQQEEQDRGGGNVAFHVHS